jgi:transcriptional adapter 2-alpha
LQTAQDFEVLIEGLICGCFCACRCVGKLLRVVDEQNLRKRIADLQEYRRMGITTGAEAEAYDNAKATRVSLSQFNEATPISTRPQSFAHLPRLATE